MTVVITRLRRRTSNLFCSASEALRCLKPLRTLPGSEREPCPSATARIWSIRARCSVRHGALGAAQLNGTVAEHVSTTHRVTLSA